MLPAKAAPLHCTFWPRCKKPLRSERHRTQHERSAHPRNNLGPIPKGA